MLDALSAAQTALLQDQFRLQSVSQNISNMQTTGYKKQLLDTVGFDEQLQTTALAVSQQMQLNTVDVQGTLIQSRQPNELAISGSGYFEVQTEQGIYYTRRGDFHINESGELVTATGAKVLGKNGVVHLDDKVYTINHQGEIIIDNRCVDQLTIVRFNHSRELKYLGEGLYESEESPMPATSSTQVLQGYLEQSNVKSMDEMMEMIKVSRHFEASQRVMRTADGLLATAINQLGETNV